MTTATASPHVPRRLAVAALATAALLAAVAYVLLSSAVEPGPRLAVNDLGQALAATAAAASCAVTAWRRAGRLRTAWGCLAAGCLSWALGEYVWSWYELVLGQETPFPSWADVGFLGMAVASFAALWLYPVADALGDRRRRLLDGLTVTTALGAVWWTTSLGAVAVAGADDRSSFLVSLAYPASDLLLVSMAVMVLCRTRSDRLALVLVGAGLGAISLADSSFAYLSATGAYTDVNVLDLGWMAGFALLALAPLAGVGSGAEGELGRLVGPSRQTATQRSLPYVPVVVAMATICTWVLLGHRVRAVSGVLAVLTVGLVLARQHLTHRENTWLLSELAEREAQLRHQAFHDGLTGLANRALFSDRVAHALELHRRDLRPLAVLYCDLDDFKVVNDTRGHAIGDELLLRVAERLQGALRSGDTLARLGGDEFAVLLEDGGEPFLVAQKVVDVLRAPFRIQGSSLDVRASVGVATVPPDAVTPSEDALLAQADTAMYAVKRSGKGGLRTFEAGMQLVEGADSGQRQALAEAVRRREITLLYQPIVNTTTGRVVSVEGLARWAPGGRAVPPQEFIALAERAGLISDLTDLVLDVACRQAAVWGRELGRDLFVGVNVSPQQISERAFPDRVDAALRRHGVPGARLVLEITESALLSDVAAATEVTGRLRALGIHLSLDDFGVGYSSLAHLSTIPLDSLKIDRAFLRGIGTDDLQARFLSALVRLGRDLGLQVIAEGVEDEGQLERLRELGCPLAQGYLFARPSTPEHLTELLLHGLPPHLLGRSAAPVDARRR